jgi:GTPase
MQEADVLVHVVDVSHPQASKQAEAVFRILGELQVSDELPMVTAWNKLDAHPNPDVVRRVANTRPDTVAVSGSTGTHQPLMWTQFSEFTSLCLTEIVCVQGNAIGVNGSLVRPS